MKNTIKINYFNKNCSDKICIQQRPGKLLQIGDEKMEKINKGKMPAEIVKLFGLLYDRESELLVRIAGENLKKQQTKQDGQNQEIDSEKSTSTTDPIKP